jgi:L-fuculose-phosphate aldolase
MTSPASSRADVVAEVMAIGRELHEAGLVAGVAGNVSVRLPDGRMLITAARCRLGRLDSHHLVETTASDEADAPAGASSELPLHRAAYVADRTVSAVVHTHAPALIAVALRRLDVSKALPEVELGTGPLVTLAPAPSGSAELARAVGDAVAAGGSVILLPRHGAVAVGRTVREAADRMELAELSAYAVLLGAGESDALVRTRVERLARRLLVRLKGSA